MSIFKRGGVYWYHFWFNGEHVQKSTKQGNPNVARTIEAAYRTALAKGEAGIFDRKPAPCLKDFKERFTDAIKVRCAEKPRTVAFYAEKLSRLLEFEPLASARLDRIDEALIESYVQERRTRVAPATVNRQLATLRRLLRLAQEWKVIDRVPRIRLLSGERNREFVLSRDHEVDYLEQSPQPLRDVAFLILDTGLRIGEALALEWESVHLDPVGDAEFGYLHVRDGKSKNAQRNVPFTSRVRAMLVVRARQVHSALVFPNPDGRAYLVTSLDHQHGTVRDSLRAPKDFVIHSLRHTYGTRLGEARADAFEIMRLMGHSSVTVSQRYVHPTPRALESAVRRLEMLNQNAAVKQTQGEPRQVPATVSATSGKSGVRKSLRAHSSVG